MAYIKASDFYQIGRWVETTTEHKSLCGKFTKGTKVKITDIGERGYSIEDEEGNKMFEIGWVI